MLRKNHGYFEAIAPEDACEDSQHLEREGYVLLSQAFSPVEINELRQAMDQVFDQHQPDQRAGQRPFDQDDMFRYEMFNRSEGCQRAVAHPRILSTIEPLLGQDCHIIANTAWRNVAHHESTHGGQGWHIDAGPHVPLQRGLSWPKEIPHPVFAIGTHIFLQDCMQDDGPTGVIPGSHRSGRFPPGKHAMDNDLEFEGQGVVPLLAKAGDVAMFVSDIWHRRMPCGETGNGRYFLQVHYGRRDIAQRVRSTSVVNHLSEEAIERAIEPRDRTLIGLHRNGFYDG